MTIAREQAEWRRKTLRVGKECMARKQERGGEQS